MQFYNLMFLAVTSVGFTMAHGFDGEHGRRLTVHMPPTNMSRQSRSYEEFMANAMATIEAAAWSSNISTQTTNENSLSGRSAFLVERDAHEFSLAASGAGAIVVLVAAAGTWNYITYRACILCATPTPATAVACYTCAIGAVGLIIQFGLAYASGKGGSGSVGVNARSIEPTISANATHSVQYIGESSAGHAYRMNYNGKHGLIVHSSANRVTLENMHEYTPDWVSAVNRNSLKKRDTYDIEWFGATFDNYNTVLDYYANNAYEQDPDFFNTIIAAGIVEQPTTKYCLSMGLGYDDANLQNAFHGEIYTNAYGGVDAYCYDNSDDWWAQGCHIEVNEWAVNPAHQQGNCYFPDS